MRTIARLDWSEVPGPLRAATESALGGHIVGTLSCESGFSPGVAARCALDDGRQVVVKAVSEQINEHSAQLNRREIQVNSHLLDVPAAPDLLWWTDDGTWVVSVFDAVEGRQPDERWPDADLDLVVDLLDGDPFAAAGTPGDIEWVGDLLDDDFSGWRRLAHADDPAGIEPWLDARVLAHAVELEREWTRHVPPERLIHVDLRADNLLLRQPPDHRGAVAVVDWANGALGTPWFDLVCMVPSVALGNDSAPWKVWERSAWAADVDRHALACAVAALSGYFTEAARRPPIDVIPMLRPFQEAQGRVARRWLARVLDS